MLQIIARTISSLATRQDGFDHLGETFEIGEGCQKGATFTTIVNVAPFGF